NHSIACGEGFRHRSVSLFTPCAHLHSCPPCCPSCCPAQGHSYRSTFLSQLKICIYPHFLIWRSPGPSAESFGLRRDHFALAILSTICENTDAFTPESAV